MKQLKISNNVIRRLPRYLRALEELKAEGADRVSSSSLGEKMGLTSSQIRQDFSCFGEFGQQGYGYNVKDLSTEIASILGTDRGFSLVVVGVGNIGRALIESFCFAQYGFELAAAFDIREELVGKVINGVEVKNVYDYKQVLEGKKIDAAVLSVPKRLANEAANAIADLGIKAIWNFTNVELSIENPNVIVEDIHFSDSLLTMSYYLAESIDINNSDSNKQEKM